MAVDIIGTLTELQKITHQIECFKEDLKNLNERKIELECAVVEYLDAKNEDGLVYRGKLYSREVKTRRGKKKKEESQRDVRKILIDHGIDSDQVTDVMDKVSNAMKGDEFETNRITVKAASGIPIKRK